MSPSSSHFKKFTYCLNHCCFSTCPGLASNVSCLYFMLSLSPPLPEQRNEHATPGFRDVLGLFSERAKLKKCRYTGACVQTVFAAAHCCTASAPTHQPAADTPDHCFLSHTHHVHSTRQFLYACSMGLIQTSYFRLRAVWLRPPNAVRRWKTLRCHLTFSDVSRIKSRGELWCPCRVGDDIFCTDILISGHVPALQLESHYSDDI